jgi:hypothetical protein
MTMKYMFLLYSDEQKFHEAPKAEQMKIVGEHMAFSEALRNAGAMVEGAPLDETKRSRRVRGSTVENGPFTDSKEQIGGYYMIEAKDLDEALDWAARCPSSGYGPIEIRPVWNIEG